MTVGFGHGIAVTPLHLATRLCDPVQRRRLPSRRPCSRSTATIRSRQGRRVFTEDTSYKMRALLRLVVTQGTGKKADAPGYRVGGKTGTAEKLLNGRYTSAGGRHELRRRVPDGRAALCDRRDARRTQGDRRNLRLPHRRLERRAGRSAARSAGSRRCSASGPTRTASPTWSRCCPSFTKRTEH